MNATNKLSYNDRKEICIKFSDGQSIVKISKGYDVSYSAIRDTVTRWGPQNGYPKKTKVISIQKRKRKPRLNLINYENQHGKVIGLGPPNKFILKCKHCGQKHIQSSREIKNNAQSRDCSLFKPHNKKYESKSLSRIVNKYNIASDEFIALKKRQNGLCAICNEEASKKEGIELAVDHNHKTGKVRGLLCSLCNMAIGTLNDDTNLLNNAIQYLNYNYLHNQKEVSQIDINKINFMHSSEIMPRSKLSDADRNKICERYSKGEKYKVIAKDFNCSEANIGHICREWGPNNGFPFTKSPQSRVKVPLKRQRIKVNLVGFENDHSIVIELERPGYFILECKHCKGKHVQSVKGLKANSWVKYCPEYRKPKTSRNNSILEKKYNISETEYLQIFKFQNGKCAICQKSQEKLTKKLSIDHDHTSKQVRGLLCPACNHALGLFKDDESIILKAISYIESSA
mgnify:CR=1 FL=1|jgi:hypothetical protein